MQAVIGALAGINKKIADIMISTKDLTAFLSAISQIAGDADTLRTKVFQPRLLV